MQSLKRKDLLTRATTRMNYENIELSERARHKWTYTA